MPLSIYRFRVQSPTGVIGSKMHIKSLQNNINKELGGAVKAGMARSRGACRRRVLPGEKTWRVSFKGGFQAAKRGVSTLSMEGSAGRSVRVARRGREKWLGRSLRVERGGRETRSEACLLAGAGAAQQFCAQLRGSLNQIGSENGHQEWRERERKEREGGRQGYEKGDAITICGAAATPASARPSTTGAGSAGGSAEAALAVLAASRPSSATRRPWRLKLWPARVDSCSTCKASG